MSPPHTLALAAAAWWSSSGRPRAGEATGAGEALQIRLLGTRAGGQSFAPGPWGNLPPCPFSAVILLCKVLTTTWMAIA